MCNFFHPKVKDLKVRPAKVRSHIYILTCRTCKRTMTIYSSPSHGPDKLTSQRFGICEDCRFEVTEKLTPEEKLEQLRTTELHVTGYREEKDEIQD